MFFPQNPLQDCSICDSSQWLFLQTDTALHRASWRWRCRLHVCWADQAARQTMVYSECKVYTKNPHRREAMVPECPHSSLPHLPRRNPWLTMKYFAIFSGKQMQCRSQLELIWDLYLFSSSDGWLKGVLFALEPTGFPGKKHAKGGTSQVWKA